MPNTTVKKNHVGFLFSLSHQTKMKLVGSFLDLPSLIENKSGTILLRVLTYRSASKNQSHHLKMKLTSKDRTTWTDLREPGLMNLICVISPENEVRKPKCQFWFTK